MTDSDQVFNLRKRVFEEWRYKRYTWQEVREKYGFSKKWFYKWLKRFLRHGEEGLKNMVRKKPLMPHALSWDQKLRIMEFYSARHKNYESYFARICKKCGIKHTVTKVAHPWTNGYAERLNQTIWQEFYLCLLSRPYASIEALNEDLQKFMRDYNFNRRHTGYKLKNGGFEYPGHAFFDVRERSNIIEIKY